MCLKLDETFLEGTRSVYLGLRDAKKFREASSYLRDVAERNAINLKTLHKYLGTRVRKPREKSLAVQLRHQEIDGYARMVWELKRERSFDDNKMSVTVAFEALRADGSIPKEVTVEGKTIAITPKVIYAAIERLDLKRLSMPVATRFERSTPMSMWQMDFSKSRYFRHVPLKTGGAGDVQVLDPTFTKRQDDGKSLQLGIAIDDASRVMFVQYFVAKGESADHVIEFVLSAFDTKDQMLLQGLPQQVYVDNGSGWIDERTKNGLRKMRVHPIFGGFEKDSTGRELKKRNKGGRGKVERAVRTIKERMEASLYLKMGAGRRLTIAELNEFVCAWVEEWNQGEHPTRRGEGKWTIFSQVAGLGNMQLRYPTDDARALFSRAIMKTVVRRKINVGNNLYAFAPSFVNDGESVEIIRDQTGYYLYADGESHKLQLDTLEDRLEVKHIATVERKDSLLSDHDLRKRYGQQLEKVFGMSFGQFFDDEDLWEDSKDFFEKPRRIDEIEEHVAMLKIRLDNRNDPGHEPQRPRSIPPIAPINIIQLPKESYVGPREG